MRRIYQRKWTRKVCCPGYLKYRDHAFDAIQEQEKLIAKFQHEEEARNKRYKVGHAQSLDRSRFTVNQRLFLVIPLFSATAFLPSLLMSRLVQVKIVDLLAITSLVCTAHILISMPNRKPAEAHLSYLGRPLSPDAGPLERCIDYLNSGLSLLVLLSAFSYRGKQGVHEGFWLICTLPAGGSFPSYSSA